MRKHFEIADAINGRIWKFQLGPLYMDFRGERPPQSWESFRLDVRLRIRPDR